MILALMFTGTLIYRTQQRQPGTSRAMTAAIVVGVLALTTFAGLWHGQQRHMSHQWLIQWATSVLLAGPRSGSAWPRATAGCPAGAPGSA